MGRQFKIIVQIVSVPVLAVWANAVIIVANSHGWYPQNQLASLMMGAMDAQIAHLLIVSVVVVSLWFTLDYHVNRRTSIIYWIWFNILKRLIRHPKRTTIASFVELRQMAIDAGLDVSASESAADNLAYRIEGELRQAAVDGNLDVYGRVYSGSVDYQDPLVLIEPKIFETRGFAFGFISRKGGNNKFMHVTRAWEPLKNSVHQAHYDIHLNRRQAVDVLKTMKGRISNET